MLRPDRQESRSWARGESIASVGGLNRGSETWRLATVAMAAKTQEDVGQGNEDDGPFRAPWPGKTGRGHTRLLEDGTARVQTGCLH